MCLGSYIKRLSVTIGIILVLESAREVQLAIKCTQLRSKLRIPHLLLEHIVQSCKVEEEYWLYHQSGKSYISEFVSMLFL